VLGNKKLEELKKQSVPMQTKVEAICKGTDAIQRFAEKHVIPILQGLVSRSDYEEALISVYYRMYTWVLSLVKLRNPIHIQAASAAARSTFELFLDLKALYNDPKLEAKYHAFTFVERFHAARTLINYIDSMSGATGSYKMERDFISDASNIAKFNSLLTTHWPAKPGKKQGTPSHWTGKDVAGRARDAGPKYEERYRKIYARLSWFVHPGLAGLGGLSSAGVEAGFAWAHGLIQEFFYEASEIVGNGLHLFDSAPDLRRRLQKARSVPAEEIILALLAAEDARGSGATG